MGDMAEPVEMTPGMREFVESIGVYFERYDLPRIGGRILGLLIVAERPLSLDDMAAALQVSRASASTNVRMIVDYGLAELVSLLGERRDYYRFSESPWERGTLVNIEATVALRRIGERGLAGMAPAAGVTRDRLEELLDFCDFAIEDQQDMLARWRERQARRGERRAER